MNYKDFDSAYTHVKAHKVSCVICKITKPENSTQRRNPFFLVKLSNFDPSKLVERASVEACCMVDVEIKTKGDHYGWNRFSS